MSNDLLEIEIVCSDNQKEWISAELESLGFNGIWEEGDRLHTYISPSDFIEKNLYDMLSKYGMENTYVTREVAQKNWNAEWESSFEPFTVDQSVRIRASFHTSEPNFVHEIVIDPRMSFGTGHHETTELMVRMMLKTDFTGRNVLDMGTGTGILAILARRLKAKYVLAIDNDANSVDNALENLKYNGTDSVDCLLGEEEQIKGQYDIILSNITKNINIRLLPVLARHVLKGGYVIISGFLDFDRQEMVEAASGLGLTVEDSIEKNKWQCLKLIKE